MRFLAALLLGALTVALATGQAGSTIPKRYGLDADIDSFPQASPKETLGSVLKAIERKRVAYLLAHLADPKFVDERVKLYGGNFDDVVLETTTKLTQEPGSVKELARFFAEGEWQEAGETATATHKDIKNRSVFMRKIGNRWFLENRIKADAGK